MGYTHHWETNENGIPAPVWKAIRADIRKLIAALPEHSASAGGYHSNDPLKVAFEADEPNKPPQITASLIRFNGTGPGDLGHETFYFERKPKREEWQEPTGPVGAFCKTARKPYDLLVAGALIVINQHASEWVTITSDGWQHEWTVALEWVRATLGGEYTMPPRIKIKQAQPA